jgi:hypothetical protein
MRRKFRGLRVLAILILLPTAAYALGELVWTGLLLTPTGTVGPNTFWIVEDKESYRFDPIIGYRVSQAPVRFSRVTNGTLEYVGTLRGNALGFQGVVGNLGDKGPGERGSLPRRIRRRSGV